MKNKESRRSDGDYNVWDLESKEYHGSGGGSGTTGVSLERDGIEMPLSPNARGAPTGILRLGDLGKVSSGTSLASGSRVPPMELKFLSQIEPSSPQPSIDRLSVTFAEDSSTRSTYYCQDIKVMDKVHFPDQSQDVQPSEDEDYSGSVMAIMQRRASVRRSKKRHSTRRGSSPFSPDILPENENGRRRSSVFTTSSGDTAITMEDSFNTAVTQEQIFENIKLHKEVLGSVKMQPWNMRKKLKLVMQAKAYIKQHEGALQERLAQSHSTRDMLARCNIYMVKKLQQFKREMANLSNWIIPWELRIKEIESHFGSVVASYFIFLRWLFWVNIVISSLWVAFVAVPEMLTADFQSERKSILPEDKYNATNFLTLWDFEGVFKYSPMFYGWYTNVTRTDHGTGYRLPLAYFFTGLVVYIFSFVATLRKMAENSRMSKLSEKEDECIFSWKLFTGWDYMIGNTETATNRVASIIMGFKEALLEEAEKKREAQSWKVIGIRVLVNIGVLSLLGLSAFAVIEVVARSNEKEATSTTWRRNEITVVMSLITLFFPIFFELLGYFEHYHPRKQLRLQLGRIMLLNLLNLYSLIFALFGKISDMTNDLQSYKHGNDSIFYTIKSAEFQQTLPIVPTPQGIIQESNIIPEYLKQDVDTLVNFLLANITTTQPSPLLLDTLSTIHASLISIANDTEAFSTFNDTLSSAYDKFTEAITAYFDNTSTITFTTPESEYDDSTLDFTQIRNTMVEFLTTVIEFFEGTTANSTLIEESIATTVASLLETSSLSSHESSSTEFFDSFTSQSSNAFDLTTTQPTTHSHCERFSTTTTTTTAIQITTKRDRAINTDYRSRSKLRSLCWETMFGQELVKLTIMDLVLTLLSILTIDFFRGLFIRYMNNCWCWDLEKKFPQYGDFKVAENILHLVNNQGMVWMGMFFSPGLVVINVVKLYIMMYLRSWAVLTCNVPHEVIFRASRSNNFYYALLLMMLFLCVLPVSYAIVWLEPSWHCGPFSGYHRIFHIFTKTLRSVLPSSLHKILDYIASPGIVIPLLMLLVLIIYYLISLSAALREANNDLKIQLRRERTEERRKMFQIADRRRRGGSDGSETNTPFGKWKKLLQGMPSNKSFDDTTPKQESIETPPNNNKPSEPAPAAGNKSTLSKFILRAIKNRSPADEAKTQQQKQKHDQQHIDDATDTEQHDSLPDDSINNTVIIDVKKLKDSGPKRSQTNNQQKKDMKKASFVNTHTAVVVSKSKEMKTRQDSIASNWSENIPVITISKTESSECILEDKTDKIHKSLDSSGDKIKIDVEKTDDDGGNPKIRYVLKKQPVVDKGDGIKKDDASDFDQPEIAAKTISDVEKNEGVEEQKKKKVFQESSSSTQTTTGTRTESSTDYKDSTFSN